MLIFKLILLIVGIGCVGLIIDGLVELGYSLLDGQPEVNDLEIRWSLWDGQDRER